MNKFTLFIFTLIISVSSLAQLNIEKGSLMFPIKPGQQNFLSGSMGELRTNHFHAGIDIKTEFRTGLNVYASDSGYVSRIKVSTYGYGKVLYITHPSGLTTVYAHLNEFNKEIGQFMLERQYENETFELDYYPEKDLLKVKKGEIIAYSGNTGSSAGPHLHYEVRDSTERVWNPLLWGFNEIKDSKPPIYQKLALRTLDINARIENEFGRMEFTPTKSGNDYIVNKPIKAFGNVGFEILTYDQMDGTSNHYGISCMEVKVNGKETFYHNIHSFTFDETKKINAHIDYETLVYKKQRFQKCYISDGNDLSTYQRDYNKGKINIESGKSYKIEIVIYDVSKNVTTLTFTIDGEDPMRSFSSTDLTKSTYNIFENILRIKAKNLGDSVAYIYCKKNLTVQQMPSYLVNNIPVYLYDLRRGLPDSIVMNKYTQTYDFIECIPPGKQAEIVKDNFVIKFPDSTLIDTLYLQLKCVKDSKGHHCIQVNDGSVPIFGKMEIKYMEDGEDSTNKSNYLSLWGTRAEDSKITSDGELVCETKYLGKFYAKKDKTPPYVGYSSHTSKSIRIKISDRESGIANYRATLDGKFILMNHEHKTGMLWSEFLDKSQTLKGLFILEVTDMAGNKQTYKKQF